MSKRPFKGSSFAQLRPDDIWEAQGLLAKWFGFQPSEMADLELTDFERWVDLAVEQIKARQKAMKKTAG
jgi:hypothetical protein